MTGAILGRFAFTAGITGALLVGCVQPNPSTAAGRSDIAGQQCALCMATNPVITGRATQSAFDASRMNRLI
jgi:hypothetical protein